MTVLFLIGRILFGGYFFYNGIRHLTHVKGTGGYASSKGVPLPSLAVVVTGILLLLGGFSVVLGIYPVIGIICLVIFLVPVTFTMHSFWADTDPQAKMGNQINFGKNLALLGADLMFLLISRPWPMSLLG